MPKATEYRALPFCVSSCLIKGKLDAYLSLAKNTECVFQCGLAGLCEVLMKSAELCVIFKVMLLNLYSRTEA